MVEKRRRRWARLAQVVVTVSLMVWLLRRLEWSSLSGWLSSLKWHLVIVAIGFLVVGHLINVARWRHLLQHRGTSFRMLLQLYGVGLFSNSFLPTGFGGDSVRAALLSGNVPVQRAIISVGLDRGIGLSGLTALLGIGLWLRLPPGLELSVGGLVSGFNHQTFFLGVFVSLAIMGLLCLIALRKVSGVRKTARRLVVGLKRNVDQSQLTIRQWLRLLMGGYALSVLSQMCIVAAHWVTLKAVGIEVTPAAAIWLVLVLALSLLFPITINGLGIREAAYVSVLGVYGVAETPALMAALLTRLANVVFALAGGAGWLVNLQPSIATDDAEKRISTNPLTARPLYRPFLIPIVLITITVLLALWRLDAAPPVWWDEGWTLCDARNWVELGHYGCLVAGEPGPSTLSAAFPVVAPIALSFRLFGVGIWQARMVGILYTVGALTLLYCLTDRLFKRPVAVATLAILLLMPHAQLHPAYMGKQVLAEMPALFFLLAGYAFFLLTLRRSPWFLPLALVFWGVALKTKTQVLPFWVVSLVVPLAAASARRRWRAVTLLAVGLLGSFLVAQEASVGQRYLLSGQTLSRAPVSGLYEVTALVGIGAVRWGTLAVMLLYGSLILLGLGYGTREWMRSFRNSDPNDAAQVVRFMLLTLAGSWFAWYVLLSAGWLRYLFPAAFVGSAFAASALYDLTDGFRFLSVINKGALALRERMSWQSGTKVIGVVLLLTVVSLTIANAVNFYGFYIGEDDTSVLQVTRFFNTATPADTLIETFDSELFLFLDRPYHYPPAQLTVALIRNVQLAKDALADYDPLAADPDYLVVGPFSRWWNLYGPIIKTGAFRLHHTAGLYEVYERVR